MILSQQSKVASRADKRGFALVLTLLALVMLTVLVVGFNAATRTEQMAARNFTYQGVAAQMANTAVNQGIALLEINVTNGVVTQPGRAWRPGVGFVDLSSAALGSGGTNMNLNVSSADVVGTNYFISTNTNTNSFRVPLIDVRVSNVLVGRYGFWIDDDGSRVNLNAAWTNARTNFLPTNSRPYSLAVFTNLPNFGSTRFSSFGPLVTATAPSSTQGWSYFFSPRQLIKMSNFDIGSYRKLMFQAAGGPGNRALGTFAVAPNGQPAALEAGGANGFLSVYGNDTYRQDRASLIGALDAVANGYLGGPKYSTYFGSGRSIRSKYGVGLTRQIIANINDAVLPASVAAFTGATAIDMLAGQNTTGDNNPVPLSVLGLRPTPYINEVAVAVVQCTNFPPGGAVTGGPTEIQIWMQCELVDPYGTGLGEDWEIKYKVGSLVFNGTYVLNGATNTFSNPLNSINWNWDGGVLAVTNEQPINQGQYLVPARAFAMEWQAGGSVPAGASNVVFSRVEVRPVLTALFRSAADPTTVRDWAISNDFPLGHFVFNNPSVVSTPLGFNGYGVFPPPAGVAFGPSIEKNDPRVRRFADYDPPLPAWQPQAVNSLGAPNAAFNAQSGTGIDGVGNDVAPAGVNIYNHPSFGPTAGAILPGWLSPFDLTRIHTGLQWRTLQLRAQSAAEAAERLVPDWAFLEAFTVSNNAAPVAAKLNVNSLVFPATSSATNFNTLIDQGMARPLAVASLLAGNTNGSAATNASINGINLGIPNQAALAGSGASSYMAVATNITTLNFTTTWRQNRPSTLPSNAFAMVSEVLEVQGVANFSPNSEAANEGRARGFYDALSAASDVFTIYSVGQALDRNGIVTGESFRRTQVARDSANAISFKVIFSEPLIWE